MEIRFRSGKLAKEANDLGLLRKTHGEHRARRIRLRLDALHAASVLEDLRHMPGRLHELSGDRAGQLSLDLDGPYRLILAPDHNPVPRRTDGGMDWNQITAVLVLEIEDTHG